MVTCARQQTQRRGVLNCSFDLGDASRLDHFPDKHFDIVMSSMVIHEMPEDKRIPVLMEMKRLGRTIILADWICPQPTRWKNTGTHLVEWAAGREHYAGFRSYMAASGMPPLLEQVGLEVVETQITSKGTIQLWVCTPGSKKPRI